MMSSSDLCIRVLLCATKAYLISCLDSTLLMNWCRLFMNWWRLLLEWLHTRCCNLWLVVFRRRWFSVSLFRFFSYLNCSPSCGARSLLCVGKALGNDAFSLILNWSFWASNFVNGFNIYFIQIWFPAHNNWISSRWSEEVATWRKAYSIGRTFMSV